MATDNDEFLPQQVLSDLKDELDILKKKLLQPDIKATELILEMESMKDAIHELNAIFQKALEQTKEENLAVMIKTINERLEAVVSQNETIAKGMIAISDKLEDFMNRQSNAAISSGVSGMSAPGMSITPSMGSPPNLRGPRMAPMPMMESYPEPGMGGGVMGGADVPPPPPGRKRVGLFK